LEIELRLLSLLDVYDIRSFFIAFLSITSVSYTSGAYQTSLNS